VQARGGWTTSIPGDPNIRFEALPGSTLPGDIRSMGYDVRDLGDGERILPAAIIEKFSMNADGELEPLTPGSTRPVTSTVTHAPVSFAWSGSISTFPDGWKHSGGR
jgi:hypothetical protein